MTHISLFTYVLSSGGLFKSVLTPSTVRNTLLHCFQGKYLLNIRRWLLLLPRLASMTSCITRLTELPWDHPLDQLLPIFFLATMNLNFSRPLPNWRYYYCYMDDTFVVFSYEDERDLFLHSLNSLHPSLLFSFEKESNLALLFLDVLVEKISFQVHHLHLSETHIHRSISVLEFLQSTET